jgi:hypothetical protein
MSGGSRIVWAPPRGDREGKVIDVDGCQLTRSWVGVSSEVPDWPTERRRTHHQKREREEVCVCVR